MSLDEDKAYLEAAGIFFGDFDGDEPESRYEINLNDVWAWACSYGEKVEEAEFPALARLHRAYGWCGVLYWASKKSNGIRSEFHDVNRAIDFVAHEEKLRADEPNSSKRAYTKLTYTLGATDQQGVKNER